MRHTMNVPPRVAVVTGASRGIGKSTALALAAEGYSLVLAGRVSATLEEAAREVAEIGPAKAVVCDVADEGSVRELFAATNEEFGRIDVLFNNAGVSIGTVPVDEMSLERWSAVVATNLTGTFLCTREAFRSMKAQRPARRTDHQQRLDLRPRPAAGLDRLHGHEARDHRPHEVDVTRRAQVRHRLRADRHRQRRDRADARMTDGVEQADGSVAAEPTFDVADVAAPSSTWRACRSRRTSSS